MSRINAVLVVSPQPRYIDEARRVYALIDRARRQTMRSWHVYYLQNSHAEDVAYVLQQAFTPNNVTAQPTGQNARSASRLSAAAMPAAAAAMEVGGGGSAAGGSGGGIAGMLGGGGLGGGSAGLVASWAVGAAGRTAGWPADRGGHTDRSPAAHRPGAGANPLLGGLEPRRHRNRTTDACGSFRTIRTTPS